MIFLRFDGFLDKKKVPIVWDLEEKIECSYRNIGFFVQKPNILIEIVVFLCKNLIFLMKNAKHLARATRGEHVRLGLSGLVLA